MMNCDDITKRLAEGSTLDAASLEHASGCASCQSLLRSLESVEPLDREFVSSIQTRLAGAAAPVKPLPSDGALVSLLTVIFLAFTLLVAYGSHMRALSVLTPLQMVVYYGLILAIALAGAAVVVGEMIPGSRLRARGGLWIVAAAIGLSLICVALFRSYDTRQFVHLGLPCISLGSVSALGAGLLFSLFARKGFLAFRRSAARVIGFLAGVTGVAVLALHCPFLSVTHILVWHFGVLLAGWLAGDLIGKRLESR